MSRTSNGVDAHFEASGQDNALRIIRTARLDWPLAPAAKLLLWNAGDYLLGLWPPQYNYSIASIRAHVHCTDTWHDALGIERPKG